jgi:hypothetical protein
MFGLRPRIATARSNSSSVKPCSAARAAVTLLPTVTQHDLPLSPRKREKRKKQSDGGKLL